MRLTYSFLSLQDLSNLSQGKRLLEILLSHGLVVDKADEGEPIRRDFEASMLPERWKGVGLAGGSSTCYFLFKGQKETKFTGMATWNLNLGPRTRAFNGVDLWLNIPKNFEVNKLINLGDELFTWSGAVYGYITEVSKDWAKTMPSGIYLGLPGLMWVNYFGSAYLMEPDFHIPADHVSVGQGVRVCLREKPSDDTLGDSSFLQNWKNQFGAEWFWKGSPNKRRIPVFDHSALIRT